MFALKLSSAAFAIVTVLAINGAARAESASEVPKDSYYGRSLTADERNGIAEEESVVPSDGRPSVPDKGDQGVIPDAAAELPSDEHAEVKKPNGNETEIILEDSKKNFKVSKKDFSNCMKEWSAQTQMTKDEWASSCRTTLQYFPGGQ